MTVFLEQREKFANAPGFIAALDQSGGSTPKALRLYGIAESSWSTEAEMFDWVHEMRTRIMTDSAFDGGRILAAILFEMTMDRQVQGKDTADYLWQEKRIVPILKVDKGLAAEDQGVQLMKPIPGLTQLLSRAREKNVFGTKMRSVIRAADRSGINQAVTQQFAIAKEILDAGLVPIIEPEIDIHCPEKDKAEAMLKAELLSHLATLTKGAEVMFKLTLPEVDNLYAECIAHPQVLKVVALSGGYSREEANTRLSKQTKMVASFSRALTEGLTKTQSDEEFHRLLDASIQSIFDASMAG